MKKDIQKFIAIVLLIFSAAMIPCVSASAYIVADVVPAIGKSTKQLFWRKYRVPFVSIQGSDEKKVVYYTAPSKNSLTLGKADKVESWRYLGANGEFYCFLYRFYSVDKVQLGYVAKDDAKIVSSSQNYLISKAGTYQFAEKNSDTTIRSTLMYYIKALEGKTAEVNIFEKKGGKRILKTSFTDGMIIRPIEGQCIIFVNSELMTLELAPASTIHSFLSLDEGILNHPKQTQNINGADDALQKLINYFNTNGYPPYVTGIYMDLDGNACIVLTRMDQSYKEKMDEIVSPYILTYQVAKYSYSELKEQQDIITAFMIEYPNGKEGLEVNLVGIVNKDNCLEVGLGKNTFEMQKLFGELITKFPAIRFIEFQAEIPL